MIENEAIEKPNLLDEALNFQRYDADECSCALQMAIQALAKQMPMKAIILKGDYVNTCTCPHCKRFLCFYQDASFIRYEKMYCNHCGQKLDWSEEESEDV